MTADPARTRAEAIWADVQAGITTPRPPWWPSEEAISAAAERAGENDHCSACKEAS